MSLGGSSRTLTVTPGSMWGSSPTFAARDGATSMCHFGVSGAGATGTETGTGTGFSAMTGAGAVGIGCGGGGACGADWEGGALAASGSIIRATTSATGARIDSHEGSL